MSKVETKDTRPARLTRAAQRAQTRARLLDAAGEVFAERGFHGATVEEISERAGYSRGALYSNFDDKADLFLALFDQRMQQNIDEVATILHDSPEPGDMIAALRRREEHHAASDEQWITLSTEFWLYAVRNPVVRPKLATRQRTARDAFARAISYQFDATGLPLPAPLEQLALILQTLDTGLQNEHLIDPEKVSSDAFYDALTFLFEAAVALATARQRAGTPQSSP